MKLCKICGAKHHAKGLCSRCYKREIYRNNPEVKEKVRKYHKEYRQRLEVKARAKEYLKKYWKTPKGKEAVRRANRKKYLKSFLKPCFPKNVIDGKRRLRTLKHMPEEQDKYLEFARQYITECEYEELQRYLKELRK